MYLKFKEIGFFKELNKKKPINYNDVPTKFKALEKKMGYSNSECAEILNLSIPTIKRLVSGKTNPFAALYQRLKNLKII